MKVIINAVEHEWGKTTISYSDLLDVVHQRSLELYGKLALPPHRPSVTWRYRSEDAETRGAQGSVGEVFGSLTEGQSVAVKDGMIFNVVVTSRA